MSRSRIALLLSVAAAFLFLSSCASTVPAGEQPDPNLIDPRTGYSGPAPQTASSRFSKAWDRFELGYFDEAERQFNAIAAATPSYLPATLALAATAIENNDLERAEKVVTEVRAQSAGYFAADVYRAEIAARRGKLEQAQEIYRGLAARPEATARVKERAEQLTRDLFDALFVRAGQEPDVNRSIAYLRQALDVRESAPARLALVQKLIGINKYEEARRQIAPLVLSRESSPDIEEALAEIDAGTGEYQSAIERLERLARSNPNPKYTQRLAEVKQKWIDANMPPQYNAAVESLRVTRAQLAVLLYWKLSAVRFAQNLAQPPIAIDIDVPGREELIRALALRLFAVDPLTRQVYPDRAVSASGVARIVSRILAYRGLPCAAAATNEPNETARAQKTLDSCGIDFAEFRANPEGEVTGRGVAALLDRASAVLSSTEK